MIYECVVVFVKCTHGKRVQYSWIRKLYIPIYNVRVHGQPVQFGRRGGLSKIDVLKSSECIFR